MSPGPDAFDVKSVHQYTTDQTTGIRRLIRESPYLRLRRSAAEVPVYLSGGKCWSETGERIEPIPKWVFEEMKKLTPAARSAVGFHIDAA